MLEDCAIILLLNACELDVNDSFLLGRNIFRYILLDLSDQVIVEKESVSRQ